MPDSLPGRAHHQNAIASPLRPAFMVRLGAHFRFFVRKKIAEDVAWRRPTIIFSGGPMVSQCQRQCQAGRGRAGCGLGGTAQA